jgi:hypothetical protein
MIEPIALIGTLVVGSAASALLDQLERRGPPGARRRKAKRGRVRFALPWVATLVVGIASGVILWVAGYPSQTSLKNGDYRDLFATSAQVSAALLIALAVEARTRIEQLKTRKEALEASVCISLGLLAGLTGLMPRLPPEVDGIALTVIPGAVLGGMLAILLIAFGKHEAPRRRRLRRAKTAGEKGPAPEGLWLPASGLPAPRVAVAGHSGSPAGSAASTPTPAASAGGPEKKLADRATDDDDRAGADATRTSSDAGGTNADGP